MVSILYALRLELEDGKKRKVAKIQTFLTFFPVGTSLLSFLNTQTAPQSRILVEKHENRS